MCDIKSVSNKRSNRKFNSILHQTNCIIRSHFNGISCDQKSVLSYLSVKINLFYYTYIFRILHQNWNKSISISSAKQENKDKILNIFLLSSINCISLHFMAFRIINRLRSVQELRPVFFRKA